jgi:hypothetical protein
MFWRELSGVNDCVVYANTIIGAVGYRVSRCMVVKENEDENWFLRNMVCVCFCR